MAEKRENKRQKIREREREIPDGYFQFSGKVVVDEKYSKIELSKNHMNKKNTVIEKRPNEFKQEKEQTKEKRV